MNNKNVNIVFMGTPDFAVPTLEILHKNYNVVTVVTVPDKAQGRGLKLQASSVKKYALENNIPVLQPESLKDEGFINSLKELNADIFVVLAFRILPKEVYTLPKIASFNIHGSLLPKYRGAAPINWAILNGDKQTGLTSFILQEKVDTGNILLKKYFEIPDNFTAGDLHDSLMPIAADLAVETVDLLLTDNYNAVSQNESETSPAPKIFKQDAKIDWVKDQENVLNFINGMSPIPCAWTLWNNEPFKIYRALKSIKKLPAGHFKIEDNSLYIGTSTLAIELMEIQQAGKKLVKVSDWIRGYRGDSEGKFE